MRWWMIVYPRRDRTRLTTAHVIDYEQDQYDLASRKTFEREVDANRYARELAKKHGLALDDSMSGILDEDDDDEN
jgi:hypothetical protein